MNAIIFSFDSIYIRFDFVKRHGKGSSLITLNILRTARAMLMNFCIVNTQRCLILISEWKVFCLFQQIFVCEKITKMNCIITKSNHLPNPTPRVTPFSYSGVIRVEMFVLKHWTFLVDIWNFNKRKSLITDKRCWMLWKAMLRETIILLSK